jgi:hypothetical protein
MMAQGARVTPLDTILHGGVPIGITTFENLSNLKKELLLTQTFVELLMEAGLTKTGQPKKGRVNQVIGEEQAYQLYAEAQRRHSEG